MKNKKRHPIIIQEVYDSKKIKKIRLPVFNSYQAIILENQQKQYK